MALFTVQLDLSTALKRFITDVLSNFQRSILMSLQELQAKVEELAGKNQQLVTEVQESNAKVDALITTAQTCKDALVAALAQIGSGGTPEQLAALTAQVQGAIDNANAAIGALDAQDTETDAAAGQVAP